MWSKGENIANFLKARKSQTPPNKTNSLQKVLGIVIKPSSFHRQVQRSLTCSLWFHNIFTLNSFGLLKANYHLVLFVSSTICQPWVHTSFLIAGKSYLSFIIYCMLMTTISIEFSGQLEQRSFQCTRNGGRKNMKARICKLAFDLWIHVKGTKITFLTY